MEAVDFKEQTDLIGKGQPEYKPIPAKWDSKEGSLSFCFSLSKEEIKKLSKTGEIWVKQLTFGEPMNPIFITTNKNEVI